jgi:hypothetical protein
MNLNYKYKLNHSDNKTPISDIHKVYLKLKKRKEERRVNFSNYLKYVINTIPPNNNGKFIVYYNYWKKTHEHEIPKINMYEIFNNDYGICFSNCNLNLKDRHDKLYYLSDTDLKFKLGNNLNKLDLLTRDYIYLTFHEILLQKINKVISPNNPPYRDIPITEQLKIDDTKYLFIKRNGKMELIDITEQEIKIIK